MTTIPLLLFPDFGAWHRVTKFDARAVALADRHYSRQSPGTGQFMPNERKEVLP